MMQRALALAEKGLYTTTPNPRVGCVVTRGDTVVGEGWHEKAGGPHAEVVALERTGTTDATLYVTLEPCSHRGATPPCADLIIQKKISRVVAAVLDPNPKASRGGEKLRAAGIQFECGLLEEEAKELNIGFFSRMTRGRPWVRMKIAATLDGRTALADGRSQWITGAEARKDGHRWRARACAILTGAGTVNADDPRLTVREVDTPRQPLKVIVDGRNEISHKAKVFEGGNVLIFSGAGPKKKSEAEHVILPNKDGKVELPQMLEELARRGINELHVEAGFRLNGSLVREGCVDEYLIYVNPSFLGDEAQGMVALTGIASLEMRKTLSLKSIDRVGEDIRILARN